jgi:DNA gyrase subunit A
LKKGANVEALENLLYKKTKLEDTFGVNMLAVADGRPETMGLIPIIRHHVNFQYEIATRKYTTLLAKEMDRKEIQEGLLKACNVIDLIIEILRGSKSRKDAEKCLTKGDVTNITFKSKASEQMAMQLCFSERQANAILEMRLYKLIGLEIDALMKEHNETLEKIALYEELLSRRSSMAKMIIKELTAFKKAYGRPRRTVVDNLAEAVVEEKPIEEKDVVFLMDRFGYAKTIDVSIYERNKETADNENRYVFICKNTDKICIFTNTGQMHWIKVLDLPAGRLKDKGTPIDNLSNYDSKNENYIYVSSLQNIAAGKVVFGTKQAMIKVVDGAEFVVGKKTTAATKLSDGDELLLVRPLNGNETMVMRSEKEMFLRIECATIPEKKKSAVGVRGMKLDANDVLKEFYILAEGDNEVLEVKGKEFALNRLRIGNRDTKGVKR